MAEKIRYAILSQIKPIYFDTVTSLTDHGDAMDTVHLDFSHAFDKVSHDTFG